MKIFFRLFLIIVIIFQFVTTLNAQIAFEVRTVQLIRTTGYLDIDVEIRSTGSPSFILGTSSFVFNYNTSALHAATLAGQRKVAANDGPWDSATDDDYADVGTSAPSAGIIGLIVNISGTGSDASGDIVPASFTRVGTLRLIVDNDVLTSQLTWRNISTITVIQCFANPGVDYSMTDITANGTFISPDDAPLPVQLTSFIGATKGNRVELTWKTATEVNSSAFEIERRATDSWTKVGEIPAAGTTNSPQEYTFVDDITNVNSVNIRYRLKTINNDGSFEYNGELAVVAGPTSYSLGRNYPNPFNPQTKIEYALPENAKVQLLVYDMIGRQVAELVNKEQVAGYYTETFDALKLASGVYFYRLTARAQGKAPFTQVKKMILLR